MIKLKVNPEYESLCTPLTPEEYESLRESIREEGLWMPLILNPEREILDGHHRHQACKEVGRSWDDPKPLVKSFGSKLLEKKFVIETNLKRRQLSTLQKAEMAMKLEPIESELARQRQIEAGKTFGKGKNSSSSNEQKLSKGNARDIVAKRVGLSPTTYSRAKKVLEEAPEELVEWVREGDLSVSRAYNMINTPVAKERIETILEKAPEQLLENVRKGRTSIGYAYTSIKRAEKHINPPSLPEGIFDIIYADPPWKYAFMAISGNPEEQYSTMTFEGICNLEVDGVKIQDKIADDAILFLWSTNPLIYEAREVMMAWGFEYKTNSSWEKSGFGLGHYYRGDHELLLLGKRGDMPTPAEKNRPSSILKAPKSTHSKKPDEVYDRIERMYPNRKYLELFARPEKIRKGWTYWGDEVEEKKMEN